MYIVLNFVYESIHTSIFLECMYIYVSCRTPCSLATMLEKKDQKITIFVCDFCMRMFVRIKYIFCQIVFVYVCRYISCCTP